MILLESLYLGVPVFASDTAGAVDIMKDQTHGSLLGSLDIHSCGNMCHKSLTRQTGNRELLKKYVEMDYEMYAIVAQYIRYYE